MKLLTKSNAPYERGILGVFVMFGAVLGTMAVQSTIDAAVKALGNGPDAWQKVTIVYALVGGSGMYFAKAVLGDTAQ